MGAAIEAGFRHHLLQRRLVGMLADRFGQVLVTAGIVGEKLAQLRQDLEGMEIVDRPELLGLDL